MHLPTRLALQTSAGERHVFSLPALARRFPNVARLPRSLRVVLESVLRNCDGKRVGEAHVRQLAEWRPDAPRSNEIPFVVARVVLQDFTGVPLLADLAAMRNAAAALGHDPRRIEPRVPVDLVVDHSITVDHYGHADSLERNMKLEFERNRERYEFMKWGMQAFDTFRVVPPGTGIVHQVNLEYLARGVVGWGVGGIEAEAAMLGQPVYFLTPDVVGVALAGQLRPGVTATDLVLTLTELLRKARVVGKFVEFFGEGTAGLSVPDRATIANMAPEYGATMGYFPVDAKTVGYLKATGRSAQVVADYAAYWQAQQMFGTPMQGDIDYSQVIKLDLATVEPSLAGPKRPQDRVGIGRVRDEFRRLFSAPVDSGGFARPAADLRARHPLPGGEDIGSGDVLIAAITSCTNTSNPSVMLAAGLLAKKAVARGLSVRPHIKTSLAPGSRVVTDYLKRTGLLGPLQKLGFHVAGYGCTTCIGNAGDLAPEINAKISDHRLVCAAVLSGNRNFEARIHPNLRANYLASPPLVVAYALAGTLQKDLMTEPVAVDSQGREVWLGELWPSNYEVDAALRVAADPAAYRRLYARIAEASPLWTAIRPRASGPVYGWPESSYIAKPPFLDGFAPEPSPLQAIRGARTLAILGDSVTTDHISPAGSIAENSPAGRWLRAQGVERTDFNSYGSRRGHHDVMVRGTFANVRIQNRMLPMRPDGSREEGGWTLHQPGGERMAIFDAAERYRAEGVPLIVFGGEEYGTGSSRDWAAKGTALLGVRAVVAASFERIHRANLVGMGVLPLQFPAGVTAAALRLDGSETFDLDFDPDSVSAGQDVSLIIRRHGGGVDRQSLRLRIDTPVEVDYARHGGILPYVLRQLIQQKIER